jgi:D-alanyl-D-alanine carboxypeptidase (penicillin-binding protein 5/6)
MCRSRPALLPGHRLALALLLALALVTLTTAPAVAQVNERRMEREVTASGAVLWDPIEQRALWGRDADVARPMASTTKIMTTWLAIENGTYDDTVTVSATAASADDRAGAASLGLQAGEQIAMDDLLTGLMLRSGNDAAVAVAEHVAGSEEAFVDQMNAAAADLGLEDTNFINASGLTNSPAHHASPLDLAVLADVAMSDKRFADIVGVKRADLPGLGTLETRNLLLNRYDGATGVKTGYMSAAGLCLVASATRDGRDLFAVVLDSDDSFADTAALLDQGFDGFTVVATAAAVPDVYRTAAGAVDLQVSEDEQHTVPRDQDVHIRTSLAPIPPADATEGTVLGEAQLVVDGEVRKRSPLRASGPLPVAEGGSSAAVAGSAMQDAIRAFVRTAPQRRPVPEATDRIVREAARS